MARKRILVHYLGTKGGGALYNYHLTNGFILGGTEVVSIVGEGNETLELHKRLSAKLHVLPVSKYSKLTLMLKILPTLMRVFSIYFRNRSEIVLVTMASPLDLLILPLWRLLGTRLAFVAHDVRIRDGAPKFGPWLSQLIARQSKWVIALSKEAEKDCIQTKCIHSRNQLVKSIHGAFCYEKEDELNDDGYLKILVFGRIEYYRGVDIALTAYKILEERGYPVRLEIWGSGNLAVFMDLIENCKRVKIENRWIGEDEVPLVFKGSGLLLAPYRHASQSGVVPLAIAMGYPVIASSIGGLKEQVTDSVDGILLGESVTAEMIVECIKGLLSNPGRLSSLYASTQRRGDELKDWRQISTALWENLK